MLGRHLFVCLFVCFFLSNRIIKFLQNERGRTTPNFMHGENITAKWFTTLESFANTRCYSVSTPSLPGSQPDFSNFIPKFITFPALSKDVNDVTPAS